MATIHYHVASVHEYKNIEQLTKYYHSSLGSHPKTTLISSAKNGYLRGLPGFNAKSISKFIGVEDATEMGHLKQIQKGVKSTTIKSNRGRPKSSTDALERTAAINDTISIPTQEPGYAKTNLVYMTVRKSEGFIASDQTGKFPRISNKGNQYFCAFYIYDQNFIEGTPIKSQKKEEPVKAYEQVYEWCERRGFKSQLHKMDNKTSKHVEDFIASQ